MAEVQCNSRHAGPESRHKQSISFRQNGKLVHMHETVPDIAAQAIAESENGAVYCSPERGVCVLPCSRPQQIGDLW